MLCEVECVSDIDIEHRDIAPSYIPKSEKPGNELRAPRLLGVAESSSLSSASSSLPSLSLEASLSSSLSSSLESSSWRRLRLEAAADGFLPRFAAGLALPFSADELSEPNVNCAANDLTAPRPRLPPRVAAGEALAGDVAMACCCCLALAAAPRLGDATAAASLPLPLPLPLPLLAEAAELLRGRELMVVHERERENDV